ncbi:hypothetical protein CMI47_16600 [Candidatus Pacearchaeota archaeon]|jgi:hypothetical protein|nr:hypothetical protein [Candidatus Pacearchaeota archaeon]|tara:strand:- start:449 stop:793 length:345 start_codon:yes stop_codon:yes gene_type:complete
MRKKKLKKKLKKNIKRGRRNRQRGLELQRNAVRLAKDMGLNAYNRDRGGAQHEMGDIEIEDKFYGCKRRKVIPKWLLPEKSEVGVVFKADRHQTMIALPLSVYYLLLKLASDDE